MKGICFFFVILFLEYPPSLCARSPTEDDIYGEDHDQAVQAAASRLAASPSVPPGSAEKDPVHRSALDYPSSGGSGRLSNDGDTLDNKVAAGGGNDKVEREKLSDFALREPIRAVASHGDQNADSETIKQKKDDITTTEDVPEGLKLVHSRTSQSEDDAVTVGTLVPSIGERMEAVIQSLLGAEIISALGHMEDVLAPLKFTGPRVTTRIDENHCVFEVDLEHLPDNASVRVGVEKRQVFVEYTNSAQEVPVGRASYTRKRKVAEDKAADQSSSSPRTATPTGYSVGHAEVFSLESFSVPDVCDHESGLAKAARIDSGKLVIKFPRINSKDITEFTHQPPMATTGAPGASDMLPGQSGESEDSSISEQEGQAAQPFEWNAEHPFARRFMHERGRAKSLRRGGQKASEGEQSGEKTPKGRRYIPLVQADAL